LTETLTESFCERCGTRYEFEAPTRLNPLRKTRGFIGGLRNYLTSQDALSDAMGDAMRSEEDDLASAQLEAFHESFNFCIDCRQYTCVNCWNNDAGRCRTCAPIPGTDDLAERLAAPAVASSAIAEAEQAFADENQRRPGLEAWPSSDLPSEAAVATNGKAVEPWPGAEAFPADAFPAEPEPEPEPVVAEVELEPEPVVAEIEPEPEAEPVVAEVEPEPEPEVAGLEPEPVVAEVEPEPILTPLRVVAWDEDAAYQVIEPGPIVELEEAVAAPEPLPEPEPVAEVEPEPVVAEMEAEPEAEPVAAEVEPEPEPVEAVEPEPEPQPQAPRIKPISETILHFPSRRAPAPTPAEDDRAAAVADTPEVAARRAQLDLLGLGDPGEGPLPTDRAPAMPYRSRGAAVSQEELARQTALRGSFWEASAREVAGAVGGQVGVQSCGQCGLSLSANARFCRRCGTRQAQSA
jgi:ribosomal protein L40E